MFTCKLITTIIVIFWNESKELMGNDNNAIGELDLRYKWLENILVMKQRVG